MSDREQNPLPLGRNEGPSRRSLLRTAIGAASVVAPSTWLTSSLLAVPSTARAEPSAFQNIKLAWSPNAVCHTPVAVAEHNGIFAKHKLNVELVKFGGATDTLLEAMSTGKADAGVGMALRWLKPLEQGFDVKLIAGTHGGCMRLVGASKTGTTSLQALRGKTIAISDMASPSKNFFSIVLQKNGIDPNKDVEWRQYPAQLLGLAVEKGEAQAIADGDPNLFLIQRKSKEELVEIATNLSGEYQNRLCCVLGVSGKFLRENQAAVIALGRALFEASDFTADNPLQAAALFAPYTPASADDIATILGTMTHRHHPVGADLQLQLALYAEELKLVGVMKPSTDPDRFSRRISADVFT